MSAFHPNLRRSEPPAHFPKPAMAAFPEFSSQADILDMTPLPTLGAEARIASCGTPIIRDGH